MTLQKIKELKQNRYKVYGVFYKKCLIYKLKNIFNGKVYIGLTTNLKKRFKSYLYHGTTGKGQMLIHRALQKYGLQNFEFEILEETTPEALDEREKFWILHFESNKKEIGYNLTNGGGRFLFTPEVKEKQSISSKNKKEVFIYNKEGVYTNRFESINSCARFFNVKHSSIVDSISKNHLIKKEFRASFELKEKIEPFESKKSKAISASMQKNRNCKTFVWRLIDQRNNTVYEEDGLRKLSLTSGYKRDILSSIAYNRPGYPEFKSFLKVIKLHLYVD